MGHRYPMNGDVRKQLLEKGGFLTLENFKDSPELNALTHLNLIFHGLTPDERDRAVLWLRDRFALSLEEPV